MIVKLMMGLGFKEIMIGARGWGSGFNEIMIGASRWGSMAMGSSLK